MDCFGFASQRLDKLIITEILCVVCPLGCNGYIPENIWSEFRGENIVLNSREVTRAVEELLAVKTTTDEFETQRDKDQAADHESAMDFERTRQARSFFETTIEPAFRNRFWQRFVDQSSRVPTNSIIRMDEIISDIQRMILTRISTDMAVPERIRSWLSSNNRIQILTETNHASYQVTLVESRQYLNSLTDVNMAAWRNFDYGAPQQPRTPKEGIWVKLLSPPLKLVDSLALIEQKLRCRLMLAYYYLAVTDREQAPTSEDFPTIDAVIEYRKGFFIGQLADICRAHSEPTEADDPSCYPGTIGRLSKMGNGHPVAQLPLDVSEQLPVIFNSIVARTIQVAFAHCDSYQKKNSLYEAITTFTSFNATEILRNTIAYTKDLLALRNNFILELGRSGGEHASTQHDTVVNIIAEINASLARSNSRILNGIEESKVNLMVLDCGSYAAGTIWHSLLSSFTVAERLQWDLANKVEVLQPKVEDRVESILDAYNMAVENVRQRLDKLPPPFRAKMMTPEGIHRRAIDQIISDEKYSAQWTEDNRA